MIKEELNPVLPLLLFISHSAFAEFIKEEVQLT